MRGNTVSASDREHGRTGWIRTAATAWALVNGPCGVALLATQVLGLPFGLHLAAIFFYITLFPGMELWEVGTRWLGLSGMPSWYYAVAFPFGVVGLNLVAYVACGAAVHWFDRLMTMRADRRRDGAAKSFGLGE